MIKSIASLLSGARKKQVPTSGWMECQKQGLKWRLEMDHSIDREIALGVFEPATTELVKKMVKPGMMVLDIGANLGYYTTIVANMVGKTGKVFAFEPVKEYFEKLLWHIRSNGFENHVQAFNHGLSDKRNEIRIGIDNSGATVHWVSTIPPVRYEEVQLYPLDQITEGYGISKIDFVKIDIDGHEPFFFGGAKEFFRWNHPVLLVEFAQLNLDSAGENVDSLRARIENCGYTIYSESTKKPFGSRTQFLVECGNYAYSANVWAIPNSLAKGGRSLEEIAESL